MHSSLVRHALYPAHEAIMGRPTFRLLDELEKSQWLNPLAFQELQLRKLSELLRTARRHSPWHAERMDKAGLRFNDNEPLSLSQFHKLPRMDKADAAQFREQIVWRGVPGGAHLYNTGGSSGRPLIFYYGRARQAADAASRMRARRWWNIEVGEPEVFLWGAPIELNKTDRIKTLRDRLFNQMLLNAFDMTSDAMDRYLRAMEDFNPSCIYGYASSLSLLAAHAHSRGIIPRLKNLKVVCSTGEPLLPEQRLLIQNVFEAPVSNEYGCRDGGLVALEDSHGQFLVNNDVILLEVLDASGVPVTPGEIGEAVLTHFYSEAQPFIRYRTGDMVRASTEKGMAGRSLLVIAEVIGRKTDFVVRPDGAVMHALSVIYVLRAVEGVGEFKIIQHSVDHLEVMIVPTHSWKDSARLWITDQLRRRMEKDIAISIEIVDKIPPEASGKHRYVVSHVSLPDYLDIKP